MVSTKVGYRLTGFFYQLLVSKHKTQHFLNKNEKITLRKDRLSLLAQIILTRFSSDWSEKCVKNGEKQKEKLKLR